MKFSTSALFLFTVSSSANVVNSQEDGGGLQNFFDMVNTTVTNAVDAYLVIDGCEKDAQALYDNNPALGDAWFAWAKTYGYTSTSAASIASGSADTVTVSYDADALAAFESACIAVGDSAAWAALPPTEYSCEENNYSFTSTATNFGSCYPTTAACEDYGQGSSAIISYIADQLSDVGITCLLDPISGDSDAADDATDTTPTTTNVDPGASANANPTNGDSDATDAPVTTNGDSDATDAPVTTNGDSDATDAPVNDSQTASTNGSTSSAAASSMIASFSVATVAAAVGTVMYL
ncbi:hypothetical protein FRACYDRAFT_260023 [Fragilariopsis cylindrus CCMP1102]|uniref:Uncharacterized protein n=1 Tax=Fragilariopsis cylindrus CCMP1102 TaxID=635003 RepID=A0A1E7FN12_9STRA|nr:hypothetical protein FRACYDRAFT_260023 [Fragilariopsis cylindrus CCMP1102]|eukprot:OEU19514.1 hypothetical protein FRACYDRAFT_260023 [Fragilariopsis cylindrus CCMP1102]